MYIIPKEPGLYVITKIAVKPKPKVESWADKYKRSDHHTDRVVRTKTAFEAVTGQKYPEPAQKHTNMAWGKGGNSNVVHVTTGSRRALSVPVERGVSYEYIPVVGSSTARTVYAHKEDSHDRTRASRAADQHLLNNIQTRLANAAFTQPPRESRTRSRRAAPVSRRASVSSVHSSSRRPSLADEDFEIVFPEKLTTKNLPPCARRAYNRGAYEQRSSSLPPTPAPRKSHLSSNAFQSSGGGFIDLGSPLFRVVGGGPPVKPSYMSSYARSAEATRPVKLPPKEEQVRNFQLPLAKRRYSFAFEDPDDFIRQSGYTPQLRTAKAYALTVPKPYVRRHVPLAVPPRHDAYIYRGEGPYVPSVIPVVQSTGFRGTSEPRKINPTASLAIHQARSSLGRIERELGMGSVSLDDAPAFDEPTVHSSYVVPVTASRTGFYRGSVPAAGRRPSYSGPSYADYNYSAPSYATTSYASRPPVAPRATRQHEIESRLELMMVPDLSPPVSYSALRSRTTDARNKMDQHKVLLDRYLPVPSGVPSDVNYEVEHKFNELADRMPQLRPHQRSRAASLPHIRPVTAPSVGRTPINDYSGAVRNPPFRPTMSDTRKRAREVLCRTKRDPHYFDY